MLPNELVSRLQLGWIPVVQSTMEVAEWVELEADTLRVGLGRDGFHFVQVSKHGIFATWSQESVRWLAPTTLKTVSTECSYGS